MFRSSQWGSFIQIPVRTSDFGFTYMFNVCYLCVLYKDPASAILSFLALRRTQGTVLMDSTFQGLICMVFYSLSLPTVDFMTKLRNTPEEKSTNHPRFLILRDSKNQWWLK